MYVRGQMSIFKSKNQKNKLHKIPLSRSTVFFHLEYKYFTVT